MDGPAGRSTAGWCDVNRHPLVLPLLALIGGILVARYRDVQLECWLTLVSLALCGWLVAARWQLGRSGLALLLAGWFALGGAAAHSQWRLFAGDDLGLGAGRVSQPVCVIARAHTAPQLQASDDRWSHPFGPVTRMLVRIEGVRDGQQWRRASGIVAIRVRGTLRTTIWPGDQLRIWGKLYRPAPPANPGELNRADYDRGRRVLGHLQIPGPDGVRLECHGSWLNVGRAIECARRHAHDLCTRYIPPEQAPLATALILGTRQQLPDDVKLAFFTTGTIHVLAISGLHLGMLVWLVWLLARTGWIPRRAALWVALLVVGPYAVLTGAQPPIVRAAALAICISGGRLLGRPAQDWNLLAASGLAVLLLEPLGVFQIGVQLSFLAVATLGHCQRLGILPPVQDPLQRLIARSQSRLVQRCRRTARIALRVWGTSLCVWLVTLPLVVHRFHVASPIAVFLNPLLWAPIATALFSGFGVLLLGDLLPPAAWICGWMCGESLKWAEHGILWSNEFPLGHLWMPGPPFWMVAVFYAGICLWSACPKIRPARWRSMLLMVCWFVAWFIYLGVQQWTLYSARDMRITFFAVGHGTCVLVELPRGKAMLYDCGRVGNPYLAANAVAHELWSRGRFGLDAIVISHADADHFNAVGPLLERIRVLRVLAAPHVCDSPSALLQKLRHTMKDRAMRMEKLFDPCEFPIRSRAAVRVLHPPLAELRAPDNANSVVLLIDYAGRRVLLPGDLEGAGLARVLSQTPIRCDVLMAPHHGSIQSSPQAMAAWSRPSSIILSSKSRPAKEWLELRNRHQAEVLDTYTYHAIRCEISGEGHITWKCWDGERWSPHGP